MRIAAALLTTVALTGAASAADLIVTEPPMAVAPAASWDGVYFGVHGGGVWGGEEDNQSEVYDDGIIILEPLPDDNADSFDISGWLLGLHAGANWQMDSFVLGVEGVLDLTSLEGSDDFSYVNEEGPNTDGTLSFSSDWQASLNVRAGVAVDSLLLYGSLGIAFADGTLTDDLESGSSFSDDNTHIGWTVAAGIEYLFDANWSGRIEARYSDFGTEGYDVDLPEDVDVSFSHTALTVGLSYKF